MSEPLNRHNGVMVEWDLEKLKRLEEAQQAAMERYADTGERTYEFEQLELDVHFVKHFLKGAIRKFENAA